MKVSIKTKKTLAAVAMVAPLALVACGSEGDVAAESSPAPSSSSAAETTTTSKEKPDQDDEAKKKAAEDSSASAAQESEAAAAPAANEVPADTNAAASNGPEGSDAAANAVENPFPEGQAEGAQVAPVEGGNPGTEADTAAIRATLEDVYAQDSMHGMIQSIERNTCESVIAANGGHEAFSVAGIPDVSYAEMGIDRSQNGVDAVNNVLVNGDRASADVTVRTQEGQDTTTQRFLHEGGQWKMCD
ncbi:hypothetical protein [Corynebacterium lubricantis]|uniref:hypothetical protein n=1 Tax=Corynebacterium lubricantis TaxID=541095 RepID=UPI00036E1540|nr:hypothetical protein [Corynebacterium lubricantis]